MEKDKKTEIIRTYAIVIAISFALTCLTLVVPCGVKDSAGMSALRFGLPFPFVQQASTLTPPEAAYPRYAGIENPLETPTRIRPLLFLIDVVIFSQIVIAVRNILRNRKERAAREAGPTAAVRIHNRRFRRR